MKRTYSAIAIIYNPNSTGKSQQKADQIARQLRTSLPDVKVAVQATKHAGHAEAITYRTALLNRHALVISVSGDGGYNEVVNGAMRAKRMGRRITIGLVPAGNANDHYASRHRGNFVKRVVEADEDQVDLIRVRSRRITRYGHSYAGVGITPQASEKLNTRKLNAWQEVKIIVSVMLHIKSVKILVGGQPRRYNSLIFSNVRRMSKVIRIPGYDAGDDGKIEVSSLYYRSVLKLLGGLMHAALFGLTADGQVKEFKFRTIKATNIQIDGEIIKLPAKANSSVSVAQHAIRTIV